MHLTINVRPRAIPDYKLAKGTILIFLPSKGEMSWYLHISSNAL